MKRTFQTGRMKSNLLGVVNFVICFNVTKSVHNAINSSSPLVNVLNFFQASTNTSRFHWNERIINEGKIPNRWPRTPLTYRGKWKIAMNWLGKVEICIKRAFVSFSRVWPDMGEPIEFRNTKDVVWCWCLLYMRCQTHRRKRWHFFSYE